MGVRMRESTDLTVTPPWEPPLTGSDADQLLAALDRQRATFRWKADELDADGLATRVGASKLTLGGLLNHLALVEDLYSANHLSGADLDPRWDQDHLEERWEEIFQRPSGSPEELYAVYDRAVARARARYRQALTDAGLDQPVHLGVPGVGQANLRRLLLDLLEEYGRHTGHADLLREAVDGRVGEDPPNVWVTPWDRADLP